MKILVTLIALYFYSAMIFSQATFNNIYNHNKSKEFNRDLHTLNNSNYLTVGSTRVPTTNSINGLIIREINPQGELVWEDFFQEPSDSLSLFFNWNHNSMIIGDSMLVIMGSAQHQATFSKGMPFYISYHLKQKKVLDFYSYQQDNHVAIHSSIYHTDGFIYSGGLIHTNISSFVISPRVAEYKHRFMFYMKVDIHGNLIWTKKSAIKEVMQINEVDSFNDDILLVGSGYEINDSIAENQAHFCAKINTLGEIMTFKNLSENNSQGSSEVEIVNNEVYFFGTTKYASEIHPTIYLVKMNENLEIKWQFSIPVSSTYGILTRSMNILQDQIIIMANVHKALEFTNNNVWSYVTSYGLDGSFNWEHLYNYSPAFTHHIDEVETTPEGNFVFLGTVFNYPNNTQDLWLFSTDSQGCGVVQDTCYYTLEQYFGLDTMVSVIETPIYHLNNIQVLNNPFDELLSIHQTVNHTTQQIFVYNTSGQIVYNGQLKQKLHINTSSWQKGIYLLQVFEDGHLLGVEKVMKQ